MKKKTLCTLSVIICGAALLLAACEGPVGPTGPAGTDGQDGISLVWKGELEAAPDGAQANWVYYNTADQKAYIYTGTAWKMLAQDGAPGGSLDWRGSYASAPANPQSGWAYYNSADKKSYIYYNSQWYILAQDGGIGQTGPQGPIGQTGPIGGGGSGGATPLDAGGEEQNGIIFIGKTDLYTFIAPTTTNTAVQVTVTTANSRVRFRVSSSAGSSAVTLVGINSYLPVQLPVQAGSGVVYVTVDMDSTATSSPVYDYTVKCVEKPDYTYTASVSSRYKIDFAFDEPVAGLTADDITITNGTGSVVKCGAPHGSGKNWILPVYVTTAGTATVSINKICIEGEDKSITLVTGGTLIIGGGGPAGGIIFYISTEGFQVDGATCNYLEAAPADIGTFKWASDAHIPTEYGGTGSSWLSISGTEGGIGKGAVNTAAILAADANAPAAKACADYVTTVDTIPYGDWFLPSGMELLQLIRTRADDVGGLETTNYYWASSENSSQMAIRYSYSTGGGSYKSSACLVRPIRAF